MKSFTAASLAVLATCVAALPSSLEARQDTSTITFSISNGLTGAQAAATVPLDDSIQSFYDLFAGSILYVDGQVLASSLLLTAFPQGTECLVKDGSGNGVATMTPDITYFDLDGNPNEAILVDVIGYSISCAY